MKNELSNQESKKLLTLCQSSNHKEVAFARIDSPVLASQLKSMVGKYGDILTYQRDLTSEKVTNSKEVGKRKTISKDETNHTFRVMVEVTKTKRTIPSYTILCCVSQRKAKRTIENKFAQFSAKLEWIPKDKFESALEEATKIEARKATLSKPNKKGTLSRLVSKIIG